MATSVAVPDIHYLNEPVGALSPRGEWKFANDALQRWFPHLTFDSIQTAFPSVDWPRIVKRLNRYGSHRVRLQTLPSGASRTIPVDLLFELRDRDPTGQIFFRVVDASREREKELLLESYSRMIERHNTELKRQQHRIEHLLGHMQDAVFCINQAARVVGPISDAAHQVFGFDIVGRDVMDTVFRCVDPASESRARIQTALAVCLGEDALQWQMEGDGLPDHVTYQRPDTDGSESLPAVSTDSICAHLGR